jgi:hypothetical protein
MVGSVIVTFGVGKTPPRFVSGQQTEAVPFNENKASGSGDRRDVIAL